MVGEKLRMFVAFDLETTGFMPGVDRIIEIGAVKFNGAEPVDSFVSLVNPRMEIPKTSTEITGITDEMVKDKPPIEDLLDEFAKFCSGHLMVAHNAPFDFQFLVEDIKKYESASPTNFIFDTCSVSRKVFPGLINYKLGTLTHFLKIKGTGFHRAKQDASHCGHVFVKILKKLKMDESNSDLFDALVKLSKNPPLKFPKIQKIHKQASLF